MDEITITISFHFNGASYKKKKSHSIVSLYLHCYRYGWFKGWLHYLDNVARPRSKIRGCGCRFMIIRYCGKLGETQWKGKLCLMINQDIITKLQYYKDGHVKASRLTTDIRDHIRQLSATCI